MPPNRPDESAGALENLHFMQVLPGTLTTYRLFYNLPNSVMQTVERDMRTNINFACAAILAVLASGLAGCMSAQQHAAAVNDASTDKMTVGTVQRSIHVGMSGAEVATVLGSPNVVTTDEQRREVWVYDKVSTQTVYSSSSGGVSALFFGGYSENAGAVSSTQKTLTVVVKYDEQGKVRDFAYHSSQF